MKSKFKYSGKTKKLPIKFLDNHCHQHRHTMAFFRYPPPPQVEYMYTYIIFQNICNNLLFCIFFILRIHQYINYTGPLNTKYTCTYTNKYIKLLHTKLATIHGARNGEHSPAFKVDTLSSGPLSCFDVKRLI